MPSLRARWTTALAGALALACSETPKDFAATPGSPEQAPQHEPAPVIDGSEGKVEGGQTGSGGLPAPFSCERLSSGACASSLAEAFADAETPLALSSSACVAAAPVDATIDGPPICNCSYSRLHYFSDTGNRFDVSFTLGLERRRAMLGEPGDGCEFRLPNATLGNPCLLESAAFEGCSLDLPDTSCESACLAASQNHAAAVARARADVEVLASTCVECNSGNCAGILRVGDNCFYGAQSSLAFGYHPTPVACESSAEDQLATAIEAHFGSSCRALEPSCTASGSSCPDAGVADASVTDASTLDASTSSGSSSNADAAGGQRDSGP
jgi:hypothetical protein